MYAPQCIYVTYKQDALVFLLIFRELGFSFRHCFRQFQLRVPTRSADRLRGVRGGVVRHRPAGREAGRAQEAAQRVPEPCQLEKGLQGAQDDAVLQARKRPLMPRYTAGKSELKKDWCSIVRNHSKNQNLVVQMKYRVTCQLAINLTGHPVHLSMFKTHLYYLVQSSSFGFFACVICSNKMGPHEKLNSIYFPPFAAAPT